MLNCFNENSEEIRILRGFLLWRKGKPPDYSKAKLEFERLAESGNVLGMVFLGEVYMAGIGTLIDFDSAETWLRRAADAGSARAHFHLG